jgi:HAD superfamily phosphoserine phosphatase-like hydrolase
MTLKYPLVCFDLDGTLVDDTIYIWKTLHETFDTDLSRRQKAYKDFFSGTISYREWFEHDLKLLSEAGADLGRIQQDLSALRPMGGAMDVISALKKRGHIVAIISGSLDIVVDHLFGPSVFDHVLINRIFFDDNGIIAGGEPTPYDLEGKARGLMHLASLEGLSSEQTVFVGDNENDVWIAEAAGLSVAFNCKSDKLRSICHKEIHTKNLMDLLPLIH